MEIVRAGLDRCLCYNESNLVDEILSFIDTDVKHYVYFCSECKCLDKINYQNEKCDICTKKTLIAPQFKRIMCEYARPYHKMCVYRYILFSDKIHSYIDKIAGRLMFDEY